MVEAERERRAVELRRAAGRVERALATLRRAVMDRERAALKLAALAPDAAAVRALGRDAVRTRLSVRMAEVLRARGDVLMGREVPWIERPLVDWSPFVWRDRVTEMPLGAADAPAVAAVLGREPTVAPAVRAKKRPRRRSKR